MYNIIYTVHSIYAETNIIYKERLQLILHYTRNVYNDTLFLVNTLKY